MKKRLVILFLSLTLITAAVIHLVTLSGGYALNGGVKLSELSEEKQLRYLKWHGVDVPDDYVDFVISIIPRMEEDPDYLYIVSNPIMHYLTEEVRDVVNDYYRR